MWGGLGTAFAGGPPGARSSASETLSFLLHKAGVMLPAAGGVCAKCLMGSRCGQLAYGQGCSLESGYLISHPGFTTYWLCDMAGGEVARGSCALVPSC